MSSFLISQLLRYDILTVSSIFHHPLELLAPSIDLSRCHLQGPNLLHGVLQVVVELFFTIVEAYETSKLAFHTKTSTLLEEDYQHKTSTLPMVKALNCALASLALRFSSVSSSSSFFFSAAAASRTCLSSCSSSMTRCSFAAAFFSRSIRFSA
jgi:hypothetical protein